MKKRIIAMTVIGIVVAIVTADLIIDSLVPLKSLASTYRLIANVGIVAISALIYRWKK